MYSWTLLTRDVHSTPYLLGVTDDLAKAQWLTEPHLISGEAFICLIETVRAAFTVNGMDSCYVRPGPDWLGRLTTSGQVRWHSVSCPRGIEAAPVASPAPSAPAEPMISKIFLIT